MDYLIKSMRLDVEVIAWLDKLKGLHGSYNKGLRHIAFSDNYGLLPKGIIEDARVDGTPFTVHRTPLPREERKPLLRPGEKKQ
jgi:hypothetical protein